MRRLAELTSEEITAQRRVERKSSKQVKKLEREAEKFAAASAAASEWGSSIGSPSSSTSALPSDRQVEDNEDALVEVLEKIVEEQEDADAVPVEHAAAEEELDEPVAPPPLWQLDAEHTQLQPEEAFFLLFSLGALSLRSSSPFDAPCTSPSPTLSILAAWRLFLLDGAALLSPPSAGLSSPTVDPRLARFDSPFLVNYASYHHFRSMGWVVRSGVKFCADWVLYGLGGPVGGHAECAVHALFDESPR